MPTGRTFARPLLIRRVAEPSRDQQALLAQTYERLTGTPLMIVAHIDPAAPIDAPPRSPSVPRESSRPERTPAGCSVA